MAEKDESNIVEEKETQEKFQDEVMINDPVMGAMSFAELDQMEVTADEQRGLMKLVSKFQMLMRNIANNTGLMPNERVTALRTLSTDFRKRLDDNSFERGERSMSMPTINGKLDGEYLETLLKSDEVLSKPEIDKQKKEIMIQNAIKSRTGFKVLKAKDGSYRWLGWVSNKFMDREGEILTEKAHLDYVKWLDENPQAAPELWTYHIPGTKREKRADFWGYLNGFLVLGGALTDKEAKALQSVDVDFAMSHGFYVLEKNKNLIEQYRTFEATVLPREAAANPWTEFNVKELIDMALNDKQRELAEQLHGSDFVTALENDTKARAELLNDAKVQSKSDDAEVEVTAVVVEEKEVAEFDVKEFGDNIVAEIMKQFNPEGLQQTLKSVHDVTQQNATAISNMTKRLEALEKSDDEKIAKELSPKIGFDWSNGFQASKAKETVLKEDDKDDEKLKQSAPNNPDEIGSLFTLGGA